MTRIPLTQDTWTEIASAVTEFSFNLTNYPDNTLLSYKVNYGDAVPAVNTDDFIHIPMDKIHNKTIAFKNTDAKNIYVMAIGADGAIIL